MIARRATAALLVCAAAVAGVGCSGGDDSGEGESSLPDVEITSLDTGEVSSLADLDGPAVVNLWATWCAPCRREIPDFEDVHQARSGEIRFVGINVGEEASQATEFLADLDVTYDQFTDPEGYVVTELDATAMPVTIVIDADEQITLRHLGPLDQDGLNEAIDDALTS